MRVAIASVHSLALGLARGFIAGRGSAPAIASRITEQAALFDGPTEMGTTEIFYLHRDH
jgi:hypothetical protein